MKLLSFMAAASSSFLTPTNFLTKHHTTQRRSLPASPWCFRPVAQQQSQGKEGTDGESKEKISLQQEPPQPMARSKNMTMEYGGQWLSSVTRHVRLYAAYIDPANGVFDQTQMDKLTLLLDTTNEFIWTPEACNKVYQYFQELVDLYEGADLTEYTLRLIGSDIEHYIRKLLYDGEIKYNMDARVLNFSMGKPRVLFNNNNLDQNAQSNQS